MSLSNPTSDAPYEYEEQAGVRLAPLACPQLGVYSEMLYRNLTGIDLAIVYDDGAIQDVPFIKDSYNRFNRKCIIQRRSCVGPQTNPDMSPLGETMKGLMTLRSWTIGSGALDRGFVYIKELNIVLCYKHRVNEVEHPFKRMTFRDTQQVMIEQLQKDTDQKSACIFTANDPLKRFHKIYGLVNNSVVEINVTDYIDERHKEATMSIITQSPTGTTSEEYSLEDLTKDGYVKLPNSALTVVGLSREGVLTRKNDRVYSQKEVDQELARVRTITERNSSQEIDQLKSDRDAAKLECDRMKAKLNQANQELDVLKSQYNTVTGSIKGQQELSSNAVAYSKNTAASAEASVKKIQAIGAIVTTVASILTMVVTVVKLSKDK